MRSLLIRTKKIIAVMKLPIKIILKVKLQKAKMKKRLKTDFGIISKISYLIGLFLRGIIKKVGIIILTIRYMVIFEA